MSGFELTTSSLIFQSIKIKQNIEFTKYGKTIKEIYFFLILQFSVLQEFSGRGEVL